MRDIDWLSTLQGSANDQWNCFSSIIESLENKFIPLKTQSTRKKKAPWMTYKAVKLVERKHKLYRKYKNKKHPAYVKAAREAHTEMRRAKRSFEKKLATNINIDRKSFFAYATNRSRAKPVIGPLVGSDGNTVAQSHEMAEMFNAYFASVFTIDDRATLTSVEPAYRGSEQDKLLNIQVDEELVKKETGLHSFR